MKKLFLFLMIFFLMFININTYATSYKFVWENTLVLVPYGDSIDKYKDIPKANLYVNNKMVDADITYNRDGDWLCYLKDVDSTVLKDYYVWYKAYENEVYRPGTCTDYKCKIQFKIVDDEKPTIKILNDEINLSSNITNFDPLSNVSIYDNCDTNLNISYSPKFSELKQGENIINIYATDSSLNNSFASYKINIIDSTLPYFLRIKPDELIFDLGSSPSLEGYFEAYDDIDGNLTNKINYPAIKTDKVGEYNYELSVTDSSGNITKEQILVKIKDLTIPEIELTKETDILNYKIDLNNFNYFGYVKNIIDNDKINYDNLSYETNILNKVGTYYIRYKYNDGINFIYKDLILKLVSYEKPIIKTNQVIIPIGAYVDLKEYIDVIDLSDDDIKNSIEINDQAVNYYKVGTYKASIYAINSSGISEVKDIEIKVLSKNEYNKYFNEKDSNNVFNILNIILISILTLILIGFIIFVIILKRKKKI